MPREPGTVWKYWTPRMFSDNYHRAFNIHYWTNNELPHPLILLLLVVPHWKVFTAEKFCCETLPKTQNQFHNFSDTKPCARTRALTKTTRITKQQQKQNNSQEQKIQFTYSNQLHSATCMLWLSSILWASTSLSTEKTDSCYFNSDKAHFLSFMYLETKYIFQISNF